MRTILLIDDHSLYSRNAALLALQIAQAEQAKIVVGTFKMPIKQPTAELSSAWETFTGSMEEETFDNRHISGHVKFLNDQSVGYGCEIEEMEITDMNSGTFARFVNDSDVFMVIKSAGDSNTVSGGQCPLNMQVVLNQLIVPVCLIPAGWKPKLFESAAYLTDLRYCRKDILSNLFGLTSLTKTAVYVAHMANAGTADLSPEYAVTLFDSLTIKPVHKARLFFHHIEQTESSTVADVLVNGMNTDTLVLTNHSAHFQQLIGDGLTIKHADVTTVPLLLYPA
jgi:hypothetical protein